MLWFEHLHRKKASCIEGASRQLQSTRKRKSTVKKDKDIYDFFNTSGSGGDLYSDSDPQFSHNGVECGDTEFDSDGSTRYQTNDSPTEKGPVFVWGNIEGDFLNQFSCSARDIVHSHPSYPLDLHHLRAAQTFRVFPDREVLELIISETNRGALRFVDEGAFGVFVLIAGQRAVKTQIPTK